MYAIQVWDVSEQNQRTITGLPLDAVASDENVISTLGYFNQVAEQQESNPIAARMIKDQKITEGWPEKGILVMSLAPVATKDQVPATGVRGTFNYIVRREVPWPGEELPCTLA